MLQFLPQQGRGSCSTAGHSHPSLARHHLEAMTHALITGHMPMLALEGMLGLRHYLLRPEELHRKIKFIQRIKPRICKNAANSMHTMLTRPLTLSARNESS